MCCGHPLTSSGECLILCDDWCDLNEGYCYLKIFEDHLRHDLKRDFNKFPEFSILMNEIQVKRYKVSPFTVSVTNSKILHVELITTNSEQVFECHLTCDSCDKTIIQFMSHYTCKSLKCKTCGCVLFTLYFPMSKFANKRLGALSLSSISNYIDELSSTTTYAIEGYSEHKIDVLRVEDDIIVLKDDIEIVKYGIQEKQLRSIRHDYISSELESSTDMRLSLIGVPCPEGNLTPDFIDITTKNVIELGTINSNSKHALENVYEGKRLKYGDIIESVGGRYGILIVGIHKVHTNIRLSRADAQRFINRFLEASQIESKIISLCGFNIFSDNTTDDYKLSKLSFEKIPLIPLEDKQYNLQTLRDFELPMTKDESKEASKLLSEELKNSRTTKKWNKNDLIDYISNYNDTNSKKDQKRLCNVPMVLPICEADYPHMTIVSGETIPTHILNLWLQAVQFESSILDPLENHMNKKANMFHPKISSEDKLSLAKIGIGGKDFDKHQDRLIHEANSKKSFHPNTNTEDIEFVLTKPWFEEQKNIFISNELRQSVVMSKKISTSFSEQQSINIWEHINNTNIITFSYFISYIFTEIAYNYKHWTPKQTFIKKKLKYGITLLMYNPKSHIFVSFSIPKDDAIPLETGYIGPRLFDCGNYYVSDFCSYNEPTVEHFLKCGPYMASLVIHLQSVSETNPMIFSKYTEQCIPHLLLLYMNNKTDVEELITSQRYLFMNLLEDVAPNPWMFIDRFPKVMRSRLTVFYLWKTIKLLEYYSTQRISKIPTQHNDMILYNYTNIKSLFCDNDISLHTKINEFYFGYVISKERGRGGDRMFKVLSKIIEHEYMFRDSDPEPFTSNEPTPKFASNKSLLKLFSQHFSSLIETKLGKDYKDKLYNDYLMEVSYTNFNKLATLKASARDHSINLKIPDIPSSANAARQIQNMLDKENPNESGKRPKMIEAIISLVEMFRNEKNRDPSHVVELLPWCLNKLIAKGRMDSDCFAKPQHGGDREIHVLEVSARIVQYHVELFSRVVCKYFPSETTCNPDTKDSFVKDHYSQSSSKFPTAFQTHSKSADASKWCQAHHTSHFSALLMAIAPEQLKPFLITALSLWPRKCLNFPTSLASTLINNLTNDNVSPLYKRFRDDFNNGTALFSSPKDSKIHIKSGMFQGILHTTSSLYHTMIQECMKSFTSGLLEYKLGMQSHISVVQGSDDSGMMITLPGNVDRKSMRICKTMLSWKENVSNHLSVYTNRCKSSIGTHDLIEYNSEWHSRHKIIKPTFRWISACLEASVTERFIDRFRIFNGVLSQCLEGGASTLECSIIQLNQCSLHYMLMGFQTQKSSSILLQSIQDYPDPAIGFFPCDFDISAGVTGVEFQLFCLYKHSNYGASLSRLDSADSTISYIPENCPKFLRIKDYQNIKLRFCNMKIYNSFLSRLSIESYEDAIEEIENDPLLLFGRHTSWKEDQPNLTLKVHSQGVKESISNVSPVLRMMASSVYLQSTKCMSMRGEDENLSLLDLISKIKSKETGKQPIHQLFPLHSEFNRVYSMLIEITNKHTLSEVVLKRTSKSKIVVFEKAMQDFPIIEMCKRHWFGLGNIPLSSSQFLSKWESIVKDFPFISLKSGIEGLRETCKTLDMTVVECKNLLESLNQRTRSVVLYDSFSKSRSLQHSITRIYWPNTKLLHVNVNDNDISSLRSKIFSLVSYWCPNSLKENLITDWICSSTILAQDYDMLPTKSLRLKIFYDYLHNANKTTLISKILAIKQGVIGYFPNRQQSKGKYRSGKGSWLGQVCGTDVSMDIQDNACQLIRIKSMRESVSLAKSLSRLIEEFKIGDYSHNNSGMKLLSNGSFSSTASSGIPVIVDSRVSFDFADKLETNEWIVRFTDFNLRLCVVDRSGGKLSEYTILSEPFTSRDWMPDTPITIADDMLHQWSLGTCCSVSEFNKIGKTIPNSFSDFSRFAKRLNSGKLESQWNLLFLRQALLNTFNLNANYDEEIVKQSKMASRDILDSIANMDFGEDLDDLDEDLLNWDDNVSQHLDKVFCFDDPCDEDDESLNALIAMLQHVGTEENFEQKVANNRCMPYSIRFFSFLNSLSTSQYNMKFVDLFEQAKQKTELRISGLLGKIISLMLMRYHVETDYSQDDEAIELDIEASILSDSIRTHEDISNLSLANLKQRLLLIRSSKEGCSQRVFDSLERAEMKVNRLIELKEHESGEVNLSKLDYESAVATIINDLKENEHYPHGSMFKVLPDPVLETTFNALLTSKNSYFESMSDFDKQKTLSSIQNKVISVPYLQLICRTYEVDLKSEIYEFSDGNKLTIHLQLSESNNSSSESGYQSFTMEI